MSNSCSEPLPEPLPSALDNFVRQFFGVIDKTFDEDGRVTWVLPPGLEDAEPVPGYPRPAGEGLAPYFLRVITGLVTDGLVGLEGAPGAPGTPGASGENAFTLTVEEFTQPAVAATVSVLVLSAAWAAVGQVLAVASAGTYRVVATNTTSNTLVLENLGYPDNVPPTSTVEAGRLVSPSGRSGDTGATGPKGDKGDKGDTGALGATGPSISPFSTVMNAVLLDSLVGDRELYLESNAWVSVGQTIFVVVNENAAAGAYFIVRNKIGGTGITATHQGVQGNVSVGDLIAAGAKVTLAGAKGQDGLGVNDFAGGVAELFINEGLSAIRDVVALPASGETVGEKIFNRADGKLYHWTGTVWELVVAAGEASDISGQLQTAQIAVGAITNDRIAANSITSDKIVAGTIQASDIAAGTITANNIMANTITGGLMAASGIITNSAQISNLVVDTAQINNNAITFPQLAQAGQLDVYLVDTEPRDILHLTVNQSGAPAVIVAGFLASPNHEVPQNAGGFGMLPEKFAWFDFRVKADGAVIGSITNFYVGGINVGLAQLTLQHTATGPVTYTLEFQNVASITSASDRATRTRILNRHIRYLELKK